MTLIICVVIAVSVGYVIGRVHNKPRQNFLRGYNEGWEAHAELMTRYRERQP